MTYEITCRHCNHEFEHDAIFKPIIGQEWAKDYGWYDDGCCPNCGSVFSFEWDCDHEDAVIIPVFHDKK